MELFVELQALQVDTLIALVVVTLLLLVFLKSSVAVDQTTILGLLDVVVEEVE
jgi:hypothetical protein